MFRQIILAAAVLVLAACSPDKAAAPEEAATSFITANVPPPATATDTKGDGVLRDADNRPYGYALLGEKFPEFTATMADGQAFDSAVLNRWMVIDIWGIWCGDCMRDAPYVAALATAIEQDPDLYFLSIHVPANASRTTPEELYGKYGSVEAYFTEKGYSYPTVLDTDMSIREKLKISWTPSYLLISPDGVIRAFRTDLSVAGGEPVKDFLKDVARVKSEVRKAEFGGAPLPAGIGPDGTMGLKGPTPFTLDAMKAAFPGHEILTDRAYVGEQAYPVFLIQTLPADRQAGHLVYVVEPDWTLGNVGSVVTRNTDVAGPDGGKVGQMKLKALSPEARSLCKFETDAVDALFVCPDSAENPRFIRAFGAGGDFDGKLSDAAPDYQEEAVLLEMKYLPPAPADDQ
ncbi:TlpA family protein disulfide reductase [Hyphomonas oceanitis]|uniref:Putative lipoprotein n=1 Tax=Hyphomonas oceanitis SCH89 TaxID=1280953 RepID=A0A059GC53_9PROT|nr:TlpA disulfide reductase family protein [Hyphomonas oceanitis]KDA04175.1 putative lipoprotein [Hyphomonas oceanitis SCH89]